MMKKKKLLIADDEYGMRQILTGIFKDDYKITEARNGQELVTMAGEEKPDIIITDVIMPQLSGYEAAEKIREKKDMKETPIIFISGRIDGGQAHELLKPSGPTTFIERPVKYEDLKELLKKFLDKK